MVYIHHKIDDMRSDNSGTTKILVTKPGRIIQSLPNMRKKGRRKEKRRKKNQCSHIISQPS